MTPIKAGNRGVLLSRGALVILVSAAHFWYDKKKLTDNPYEFQKDA
jgi:hypothetical protein